MAISNSIVQYYNNVLSNFLKGVIQQSGLIAEHHTLLQIINLYFN